MKNLPLILSVAVVAAAASFATTWFASKSNAKAAVTAAPSDELARVQQSIASLEGQQSEIVRSIADLKAEIAAQARGESRLPLGEIDAAVARALDARLKSVDQAAPPAKSAAATPAKTKPQSYLARLKADDVSWDDAQAIWKEAIAEGELDDVVALFEELAKQNPDDAEAQIDLGHAYLQKVFTSGGGPETGKWAIAADRAYDSALKIDDHSWEARFSKAVSLSHWPAVFGKQNEAIKNFEILVSQQEGRTQKEDFAQTHFLLGNMYQQIGEKDKALAAWQKGLALFPNDASLAAQIASAQGN